MRELVDDGAILIACGGGGIPVAAAPDGSLHGVEAVIDKDHASALLALALDADVLLVLTGAERVALRWGTPDAEQLGAIDTRRLRALHDEGHFPPGSMGPKVEAAMDFVTKSGRPEVRAIITDDLHALAALEGRAGTVVTR